jgi:outer membrane protein assembly factor BamB
LATVLTAVEPVVATPWDIRHDAEELLDDLGAKRGEPATLLERTQTMLAAHGDSLISTRGTCLPLAEALARALEAAGFARAFTDTFSSAAERRLHEVEAGTTEAELRRLALSYPGTAAAARVWRRLADHAWDSGRLGFYLECAARAGDATTPHLSDRVAAAYRLLAPPTGPALPASLDGLDELWRLEVPEAVRPTETSRARSYRRPAMPPPSLGRLVLTTTAGGESTAASDGRHCFIFDHLVGRLQGEIHALGDYGLAPQQCRPVALPDGFAVLGLTGNGLLLMALDRLGGVRWRVQTPALNAPVNSSGPVALDGLVLIAVMTASQEGAELRVLAFAADTGKLAWNTLVARVPVPRQMRMAYGDVGWMCPALCAHAGYLLVLSNNGFLARVDSDGGVRRLWTYPSSVDELDDELAYEERAPGRAGSVISDGRFAVVTPADNPALALVLGTEEQEPRTYLGDGANGEVLDVAEGQALMGGNRAIVLLDLGESRPRWSVPFAARGFPQGRLGGGRALVTSREQLMLVDCATGKPISVRGALDQPIAIATAPDLLMAATTARVIGYGKGTSFLERLNAAVAAAPADYRPLVALASLHESRNQPDLAFGCLTQALERGAPADYAERAARLVRRRLELAAGDTKVFPDLVAQLDALIAFDPRLMGESAFWHALHAERTGDAARAAAAYREALQALSHQLRFTDGVEAEVQALAATGLTRTGGQPLPGWLAPVPAPPVPGAATAPWTRPGHRRDAVLVAGGCAIGYSDGVLSALRLSDGTEVWWRRPARPLLGVRAQMAEPTKGQDGIPLTVVDGSSAAAAGLKSGDVLVAFNGNPTTDFERDLRAVVANAASRSPFTAKVRRGAQTLDFQGLLGGEMVEPIAVNRATVLVWPTLEGQPEGMWFAAHDLVTGEQLWRYSLPPATTAQPPFRPLLTDGDQVITQEGADLVCLQAHSPEPQVLWRLTGRTGLGQARLLGAGLLWLPDGDRDRAGLVDARTGRTLFILPEDPEADGILGDGRLVTLGTEGRINCWDLGLGRRCWTTRLAYAAVITVSGDGVYALNEGHQLVLLDGVSGTERRRFGEWSTVEGWRCDQRRLYLHARRSDRTQALVAIGLPGGALLWERRLPTGQEVRQLLLTSSGFGCVLGVSTEAALLLLGADGNPTQVHLLAAQEGVIPLARGVLATSPEGLRVLDAPLPPPPAALPCATAGAGELPAVAAALLPKLAWQSTGRGAYAVAKGGNEILLFARRPPGCAPLILMVNDPEPLLEVTGQTVIVTDDGARLNTDGGWRSAGAASLPTKDGVRCEVIRIAPPVDRPPGTPLLLRATCGEATDAAPAPWWLHQAWRPVKGLP